MSVKGQTQTHMLPLVLTSGSALYRRQVLAISGLVRTQADLVTLNTPVPCQGPAWSKQMVEQMRKRWHNIRDQYTAYIAYCRNPQLPRQGTDVEGTILSIQQLLYAVQDTLIQFTSMADGASLQMLDLLREVLLHLRYWRHDARPANAPSYAGGSQNFEYNLLFRFAGFPSNWRSCVDVVGVLGEKYGAHFKRREKEWQSAYYELYKALAPYPGDTGAFVGAFHGRLSEVGGTLRSVSMAESCSFRAQKSKLTKSCCSVDVHLKRTDSWGRKSDDPRANATGLGNPSAVDWEPRAHVSGSVAHRIDARVDCIWWWSTSHEGAALHLTADSRAPFSLPPPSPFTNTM